MAPKIVFSRLASKSIGVADREANKNAHKNTDQHNTRRFSVFCLGYFIIEHCNFSWIPYYQDIKYGEGKRVITVIYRESKLRFFLYCLQMIFLSICLFQSAYNGFDLSKYFDDYPGVSNRNDKTECSSSITMSQIRNKCCSLIGRVLTYDRWAPVVDYRRRINVMTFTFILNSLAQKFYYLLRHQMPKIARPSIIGAEKSSNCEIIQTERFLFSFKLSLSEHILYCFLNRRPVPEELIRLNPILKETTMNDILEFNFMAIRNHNGLICTSQLFRQFVRFAFIGVIFLMIACVACALVQIFLIYIYSQGEYTSWNVFTYFLERCDFMLLTFLNITVFSDSATLISMASLLSHRLTIYNIQLVRFIDHLRAMSTDNNSRNNYRSFAIKGEKSKNHQSQATGYTNVYMNQNNDGVICKHIYSTENQSLDAQSHRLIVILDQLLFELKLLKEVFVNRMDLDILISLCSYTWVLSTWLVAYNCKSCVTKWPILLITSMGSAYLINVLAQVFFLARLPQKVSYIFVLVIQSSYLI